MASLPPLSSDIFAEKVFASKASAAATAAKASFEKQCAACQKIYYSENGYQNHIGSQKHRVNLARLQRRSSAENDVETNSMISSAFSLGDPVNTPQASDIDRSQTMQQVTDGIRGVTVNDSKSDVNHEAKTQDSVSEANGSNHKQTTEDQETKAIDKVMLTCLFCNYVSPSLGLNLTHMSRFHGMFIPEQEYLVDVKGLLCHLHSKVHVSHQCLYCGKERQAASAAQTHMRDLGHCMIAFSTEGEMVEIGQFYDFRSTYSDEDDEEQDDEEMDDSHPSGGVKLGAKRDVTVTVDGQGDVGMQDDDEDGWESGSSLSSVPTEEITSVPLHDHSHRYKTLHRHRHHSHIDPRPHHASDGWHSHAHSTPHAVYHDEYELHLPSGRTAGHRSLARYYRQNLHNYPSQAERRARQLAIANGAESTETEADARSHDRGRQLISRADGGLGMANVSDAKKREIRAVEKRERKRVQRQQARQDWGVEKRANHQKHFRVSGVTWMQVIINANVLSRILCCSKLLATCAEVSP